MLQEVCDVLQRAGFVTQAGGRGLTVEPVPEGIRVVWRPELARLGAVVSLGAGGSAGHQRREGLGGGVQAAMSTAVAAVLELAGFQVRVGEEEVLVTGPAEPSSAANGSDRAPA